MKTYNPICRFFVKSELYVVACAVGFSILYEPFLVYSTVIALFFLLIRWATNGQPLLSIPTNLPVLVLLLTVITSCYITPIPGVTILQATRLLNGILLFLCFLNEVQSPKRINLVLWGLGILGLLLTASSFFFVDWAQKFDFIPRSLSILTSKNSLRDINPNVTAGILVLLLVGICTFVFFRWKVLNRVQKGGSIFAIIFMLAIFFLMQSRGSSIAFIFALTILILLRFRRGWIFIVLVLAVTGILLFQAGPQQVLGMLGDETGGGFSTLIKRENIWLRTKLMISDFPFTGVGMGTFSHVMDTFYPIATQPVNIPHAHNLFLQIAVDLGLPGLIAWLACWFSILFMAWQLYYKGNDTLRTLGAAVLCSQAAMGVHGLTDCVTWDTRPAVIVWVIWGLTAAAWLQLRSSPSQPAHAAIASLEKPLGSELFPPIRSHPKTGS